MRVSVRRAARSRNIADLLVPASKEINIAAAQSLTGAARWARTRIARDTASAKQLKVGPVRRRMKVRPARRKRLRARISAIWEPALLHHAKGRMRQTAVGVTAGAYSERSAFLQKPSHGRNRNPERKIAFKRVGRARLPIDTVKVDLNPHADMVAKRVTKVDAGAWWQKEFERILDMRLRRARLK